MIRRILGDITKNEIKEILNQHYTKCTESEINRKLSIIPYSKDSKPACYFFSLDGSPPKGYGIYIPEIKILNLYDNVGDRIQEIKLLKGIIDL